MARSDESRLEWHAWPARERPLVAAGAALFVVLVSVLMAGIGGHVLVGLGAVVILFGSLNPFFSPTTFRLDHEGVTLERWPVKKTRAWRDIHGAYADRHGLTLSPFRGRPWLEPYRGVRLLFAANGADVRQFVRDRLVEGVELVDLAHTRTARRNRGAHRGDPEGAGTDARAIEREDERR